MHSFESVPSSARHISDTGAPRSLSNVYFALGSFCSCDQVKLRNMAVSAGRKTYCYEGSKHLLWLIFSFSCGHGFVVWLSATEKFVRERHGSDVVWGGNTDSDTQSSFQETVLFTTLVSIVYNVYQEAMDNSAARMSGLHIGTLRVSWESLTD